MLAIERDVKPRNITFAKVDRRVEVAINREWAIVRINTVSLLC